MEHCANAGSVKLEERKMLAREVSQSVVQLSLRVMLWCLAHVLEWSFSVFSREISLWYSQYCVDICVHAISRTAGTYMMYGSNSLSI